MPNPVLVIAGARTGSQLLCQSLGQHPQLRFLGEVVNPLAREYGMTEALEHWHRQFFGDQLPLVSSYQSVVTQRGVIQDDAPLADFLQAIFVPGNVGKILYDQLPICYRAWNTLFRIDELCVIHLTRRNWLRSLVSFILALRDKSFVLEKGAAPPADAPVRIPSIVCLDYFTYLERHVGYFSTLASKFRWLEIEYEAMVNDWSLTMTGVQEAAGVAIHELEKATAKRTRKSLKEILSNYDQLERFFAGTRWARFFEEDG